MAENQGRRATGLKSPHHGKRPAQTGVPVLLEPHPVGTDVAGVAHGNTQPVRSISQDVHHFEGRRFLSLEPVGVDGVHQGDGIAPRQVLGEGKGLVEVALNGQHFGAVQQSLGQLALGHVAIRNDGKCPQTPTSGIGRCRCGRIACAGADDGRGPRLLGLADGHGHAPILEAARGVQAVHLQEHPHAAANALLQGWGSQQRRVALQQADNGGVVINRQPGSVILHQTRPNLCRRPPGPARLTGQKLLQ